MHLNSVLMSLHVNILTQSVSTSDHCHFPPDLRADVRTEVDEIHREEPDSWNPATRLQTLEPTKYSF